LYVAARGDRSRGGLEVGIVVHDGRRLAAELEMHTRRRRRRSLHDRSAGARRAGDRHHRDLRVPNQRLADGGIAGHHVQDTRRQAGFDGQLCDPERGSRGLG